MTAALDIRPAPQETSSALAIRPGQDMWDDRQRAALASLGIRGATDAELSVYMHYCQRTGLDPFSKQIYLIKRREKVDGQWVDKWSIQTGIDGFRVIRDRIAARTRETVEYEDTIWYDADGGQHDVWISKEPPAACKVTVLRGGRRFPAVVRFDSYAQRGQDGNLNSMWSKRGDGQIEKCAEAAALRKAFPHDLGGLYIEEEMAEDAGHDRMPTPRTTAADLTGDQPPVIQAQVVPETPAGPTPQQLKRAQVALTRILAKYPLGEPADVAGFLAWRTGKQTADDLDADGITAVSAYLNEALENAGGEYEAAAAAIWAEYNATRGGVTEDGQFYGTSG